MPKATVLMPVYNAQKHVRAAIESILGQTLTDFEFIIIDDCSTDASAAIVESYRDARIRFFRNSENRGISWTLNRGIELATTALIARMDADDISYPQRLQVQVDYLTTHPECAMVSAGVQVMAEDGSFLSKDIFENRLHYYNLTFVCTVYHPTVMYRRQAVEEIGRYTVPYSEDYELFWQLLRRFVITNLPVVLLAYRLSAQSLHQVFKKEESECAQQQQVLRNIRYYTGPHYCLPATHIECLRHQFQPLLAEQSVSSIMQCLRSLEFITACILQKANVNLDRDAVTAAAHHKKMFIAHFYIRHLPTAKGVVLALRLGLYKVAARKVLHP